MKTFGYLRISSADQNLSRQLDAMHELGIHESNIFIDKQSGKDFNRPAWNQMLEKLEAGDLLYLHSLDRAGRRYDELLNSWRILTKEKGVDIKVLDMPLLDTTTAKDLLGTFISDLVLQLLSFIAETERLTIRKRQAEGIAAAKARGVKFGRPSQKVPENFDDIARRHWRGKITLSEMLAESGLSKTTLYRRLAEWQAASRRS